MAYFNQQRGAAYTTPNTTNLAGGKAFTMSARMEIVTILLTTFLKDKFYEKSDATVQRLTALIQGLQEHEDIIFIAKAIVYARTIFGMRSITHVATVAITPKITTMAKRGPRCSRGFFKSVIHRPDDITEILSYLKHVSPKKHGKKGKIGVPNIGSMRKGFADALRSFSPYALAKYRGHDKEIKLADAINWCHPKKIENAQAVTAAIAALVKGELRNEETWEAMLSAAGKDTMKKAEVWKTLLESRKLGYLALLRNLRNIMEQAPDMLPKALESLTSEAFITKSLILPFQYMTAYKEFKDLGTAQSRILITGLSKAIDISLANVPKFEGDTVVVLDVSGSMASRHSGNQTCAEVAALFGAVIAKANNADLMLFTGDAKYVNYNPTDSTLTLAQSIAFSSGSTNFPAIFTTLKRKYDRIVILSDMQGWVDRELPNHVAAYRHRTKSNPRIYSFDLSGYGSLQLHEDRTFLLAGFSNETMKLMNYLEKDKDAIQTEISKIEL